MGLALATVVLSVIGLAIFGIVSQVRLHRLAAAFVQRCNEIQAKACDRCGSSAFLRTGKEPERKGRVCLTCRHEWEVK